MNAAEPMGLELERRTRARRALRARRARARRAYARGAALGVGAARAGAARAAAAPALALLLQVVCGRRDERRSLPALDALARRVRVVRLAGRRRRHDRRRRAPAHAAPPALPLLSAHPARAPRRRPRLPLKQPRPPAWTNFVLPFQLNKRPRGFNSGRSSTRTKSICNKI